MCQSMRSLNQLHFWCKPVENKFFNRKYYYDPSKLLPKVKFLENVRQVVRIAMFEKAERYTGHVSRGHVHALMA